MNENELYFSILEFLSQNGISRRVNVFEQFNRYVTTPPTLPERNNVGHRSEHLNRFLKAMDDNGHITFTPFNSQKTEVDQQFWMESFNINAAITPLGLDFYQKLLINQSSLLTNESIRDTNQITKISLILTVFFSIATAVITILNYNLSGDNYKLSMQTAKADSINSITVSRRLDTLQQVLKSLQESLPLPKDQKTFPQPKRPSH